MLKMDPAQLSSWKTELTDTKNTLLCEKNYKHISVKNALLETFQSTRKRKQNLNLTSTVWKNSPDIYREDPELSRHGNFEFHSPPGGHIVKRKKKAAPVPNRDVVTDFVPDKTDGIYFGQQNLQEAMIFSAPPQVGFGGLSGCMRSCPIPQLPIADEPLQKMPEYVFEPEYFAESTSLDFIPLEDDVELILEKEKKALEHIKLSLLSIVSTSLFYSPNYRRTDDFCRVLLTTEAEKASSFDPEFVLKVALYSRRELNIRSTSNFLLAYAAYNTNCRPFLKKYFEAAICLPSDWLEVAQIYITFEDTDHKPGVLPSALRKVMVSSFGKFDEYQLAKYNKKKKDKNIIKSNFVSESEQKKPFSLKYLIKALHISSPVEPVLCLLGKKYPNDPESFRMSGLPGTWNPEKKGKRMKLPVPETWETMISSKGNKSCVWKLLIDKSKLPYMAMLRNLKNIICSGIEKKYHQKINSNIMNENAVLKSKQFPLRFYAAYKTVEQIEQMVVEGSNVDSDLPWWQIRQKRTMAERLTNIDISVLKQYKASLSKALEVSVLSNVDPIAGNTLVICDLVKSCQGESLGDSLDEKALHNCVLFGLICLKACENCELKLIHGKNDVEQVKRANNSLLESMMRICSSSKPSCDDPENQLLTALSKLLEECLYPSALLSKKVNNLILLVSSSVDCEKVKKLMNRFLQKYRTLANADLLYIQVNIASGQSDPSFEDSAKTNNVYLSGCSDQILKFLSEKGSGKQLAYVEGIDEKYHLNSSAVSLKKHPNSTQTSSVPFTRDIVPKWQTIRVFISSTFKDMHGERDLLIRYVFPELKSRASKLFVKIIEIDLRWGVSESYLESEKCVEFCLREAENCDIFIGVLGERYGTVCDLEDPDPQFNWIEKYPIGTSITELEIEAGALKNSKSKARSFFYIRNSDFIRTVPEIWIDSFKAESTDAQNRLTTLKDRIRKNDVNLFDGYPCHWGGVVDEKPFVAGLDEFGNKVLSDLWQTIQKSHSKEQQVDELSYEYQCHLSHVELYRDGIGEQKKTLSLMLKEIEKNTGIFLVTGRPGCGKTAFLARLLKTIGLHSAVPFFIGATAKSVELQFMLLCISHFMALAQNSKPQFRDIRKDIINEFPDILLDGVKSSHGKLILVLDGLDHLQGSAQSLDWLPYDIPKGAKIICSASNTSTPFKVLSRRAHHGSVVHFTELHDLNIFDRKEIVKHFLEEHGKTLDDGAFKNEMIQLLSKVDCGLPLYIQLACDYLKMFATFDNLMSSIQNFPSTLPHCMEYIVTEMGKHMDPNTTKKALLLLGLVKEGLDESELHLLLSFVTTHSEMAEESQFEELLNLISTFSTERLLIPIDFREVLHILRIFVLRGTRGDFMKISSSLMVDILKKSFHEKEERFVHQVLAAFYLLICDPQRDGTFGGYSAIAIRSLPYHLYNAHSYTVLAKTLCSLPFIQLVFQLKANEEVLIHFTQLLDMKTSESEIVSSCVKGVNSEEIKEYYEFILHNSHILTRYPILTMQQALNEPVASHIYKAVNRKSLMLECTTRSSEANYHRLTISTPKIASCVTLHDHRPIAAIGREDGFIKLLDLNTGKIIFSLKRHISDVTAICFIGNERLVTSSSDNSLCLWSIMDFVLLSVLEGHTRHVSCCTSDSTGKLILSSSWDGTVRIWNVKDGSEVCTLSDFKCPINCIAHHPYSQSFVCGLWNGDAEIWDSLSLKQKLVLHGHSGSVQFIAYSMDGINIVSSSITAELFIWSSDQGVKMYSLKGHTLPVNSICFSLDNNFLLSASDDCSLKVWSNVQHQSVHRIMGSKFCPVHVMEIITPNHLAVAFKNHHVWLVDLTDGHIISQFENIPDQVTSFSWCNETFQKTTSSFQDPSVLIICGLGNGKILALNAAEKSHPVLYDVNSSVTSLVHVRNVLMFGSSNGDIGISSVLNGSKKKSDIMHGSHNGSITALSIVSSGEKGFGLSASTDMTIKLWEITTLTERFTLSLLQDIQITQRDFITACFLLPMVDSDVGNLKFITGSADNTVAFWNDDLPIVLEGLQASPIKVYSTDNYIFGCSQDGVVAAWTKTGSLIAKNNAMKEYTSSLAYYLHSDILYPDNASILLAFVNSDGTITINKPFQKTLFCSFEGHGKPVTSCSVNIHGDVISSSPDKSVNLWKIPSTVLNTTTYHEGKITGIIIVKSGDFAFSSDIKGNLILWAVEAEAVDSPLRYCCNKKYVGGLINSIIPMDGKEIACAVILPGRNKPEHQISVVTINDELNESDKTVFIKEIKTIYVSEEICCFDHSGLHDTFIIGLKTGSVMLINSEMTKCFKVTRDWVLKLKISDDDQDLCVVDSLGNVKRYLFSGLFENPSWKCKPVRTIPLTMLEEQDLIWTTSLSYDAMEFYAGDANGWLRIFTDCLLFTEQIHSDSVTGICVDETYTFTCSTDKTVKVWDAQDYKQVAQFHCSTPITCMTIYSKKQNDEKYFIIMIGTSAGDVKLLKLWPESRS